MATPKYQTEQTDVEGCYTRIKNVYIRMRDGVELCANLFLPFSAAKEGHQVPVIFSLGPYGKDVHVKDFGKPQTNMYADMYSKVKPLGPDACFELADPILWTKDYGYAILRVDSRGIGGSQGRLDPFGLERSLEIGVDAEGQDLYDIVEWAGTQAWSNGRVATSGISYYGMIGYWTAMQKPPHLTCIMSYESACDHYQSSRRGGIASANFVELWYKNIVIPFQSGQGRLSEQELTSSRADYPGLVQRDEYPTQAPWKVLYEHRKLSDIEVPFYIAGNWTDAEIHLPGNILAYNNISSHYKWLEMHTGNHLFSYHAPEHVAFQRQFLDYFMLDKKDNGMLEAAAFTYQGLEGCVEFQQSAPFAEPVEILGSPYLEIEVSTEAPDMDLFIYLRAVDANNQIIVLEGNHSEPMDSFARGYFRLSHRDEIEQGFAKENKIAGVVALPPSSVEKAKVYKIIVPLYPTAYLFEKGQKVWVEIGAQDTKSTIPPMRHDARDRVPERLGGANTVFSHGRLVIPTVKR